ncbi:hypothetical protein PsYK624_135400 [Phanerochaete sordida]|uniref:Fungal-type protein kinase domain-containing protein n=1 Tax=Phanerochaete sordida TaxID=48140 RepID=A0A9P3GPX2_9APHY|nr:hypothetical protein PsYK624_135400 [Phanerochaete sordida]
MAPGRDQFQYSEVPLGVFLANFDLEFSKKRVKSMNGTAKGSSSGLVSDKTSDSGLLCNALDGIVNGSEYRYLAVPKSSSTPAFTPTIALFQRPDTVDANNVWAWLVSPVDNVSDEALAGFHFALPGETANERMPFLVDTDAGGKARRQLEECISEMLLHQHRVHVFMLHISHFAARVSRWDRAGCVVSEAIDLKGRLFDDIVFRLAHLSQADIGFDDGAKLASPAQVEKLRQYKPENAYLKDYRDRILECAEAYPIYEISCPLINKHLLQQTRKHAQGFFDDSDSEDEGPIRWNLPRSKQTKTYLVGRPLTTRRPLAGKSTVGFVAFDVAQARLVFVKDQWRVADDMVTELGVYEDFVSHAIRGIAQLEAGGDVARQRTRSQDFADSAFRNEMTVERVHTRLVSETVGRPLKDFDSGESLLRHVAFAVNAHKAAIKAGVLHHDISHGNILIDAKTGFGFLNDWDVSIFTAYIQDKAERVGFGGTWAYGSALALAYPQKPFEVEDDIEAFIWLIVYMAICYMEHDLSKDEQEALVENLFHAREVFPTTDEEEREQYIGGALKLHYIQLGKPPVQLRNRSDPVAVFLDAAFKLLHDLYAKIDFPAIEHWRGGARGPRSFVPGRGSNSVLDGLTHEVLYGMLVKAGNGWAEWRREAERKRQAQTMKTVSEFVARASVEMSR